MRKRWIIAWPTSRRFPHDTRANGGEVLAGPVSPLGRTFGWDGGIVAGYEAGLIRCGVYDDRDFDPEHPESVVCFGGCLYMSAACRAAWDAFVHQFGSRGPDEWDISSPTCETHPRSALVALDRVRLHDGTVAVLSKGAPR